MSFCSVCVCVFTQTDGASAVLIMSEEKALAMGYKPKAYLRYKTKIMPYIKNYHQQHLTDNIICVRETI